jgi:hypothetical protein
MPARKKTATGKKSRRTPRTKVESAAQNYTVNVYGARPHRIEGTPTPAFTETHPSSRKAERVMKAEAAKLGVGAYGEITLPDAGGKLYRQGEIKEGARGKLSFVLDREI